jgi:hypothetical protein
LSFSILIIKGMVDTTDAEHYLGHPQCAHKLSAALLAHLEQAALPSHQKAIANFHKAAEEVKIAKLPGCAKEIRVPTTSNSLHNDT